MCITLLLFNRAMENAPFIDGLPIKNGGSFHGYVSHNQMVPFPSARIDWGSREVMVFLARPVLGFAVAALLSLGPRYGAGSPGSMGKNRQDTWNDGNIHGIRIGS